VVGNCIGEVVQGGRDMDWDEARWSGQRAAATHTNEKGTEVGSG
jgi:hypothetical protein